MSLSRRSPLDTVLAAAPDDQVAWRSLAPFAFLKDVLAVADATRRVGAVTLASTLTRGATAHHGQLAAARAYQSAVGLIVRDALSEACLLYEPWLAVFGPSANAGDVTTPGAPYPSSTELGA
jgi:hypothetical protein